VPKIAICHVRQVGQGHENIDRQQPVTAGERIFFRTLDRHPPGPGAADRMLIAGPRYLRPVLEEYVAHFSRHRPHRAGNLGWPGHDDGTAAPAYRPRGGSGRRRDVLGGSSTSTSKPHDVPLPAVKLQVSHSDDVLGPCRASPAMQDPCPEL
jgi:hypothetical protein